MRPLFAAYPEISRKSRGILRSMPIGKAGLPLVPSCHAIVAVKACARAEDGLCLRAPRRADRNQPEDADGVADLGGSESVADPMLRISRSCQRDPYLRRAYSSRHGMYR